MGKKSAAPETTSGFRAIPELLTRWHGRGRRLLADMMGEEGAEEPAGLVETLRRQTRPDGTPVFSLATGLSLLVFFVLAMQCLPTQVVTKRETGSWRWAVFQFVYMTALAYVAALIVYQSLSAAGYA